MERECDALSPSESHASMGKMRRDLLLRAVNESKIMKDIAYAMPSFAGEHLPVRHFDCVRCACFNRPSPYIKMCYIRRERMHELLPAFQKTLGCDMISYEILRALYHRLVPDCIDSAAITAPGLTRPCYLTSMMISFVTAVPSNAFDSLSAWFITSLPLDCTKELQQMLLARVAGALTYLSMRVNFSRVPSHVAHSWPRYWAYGLDAFKVEAYPPFRYKRSMDMAAVKDIILHNRRFLLGPNIISSPMDSYYIGITSLVVISLYEIRKHNFFRSRDYDECRAASTMD